MAPGESQFERVRRAATQTVVVVCTAIAVVLAYTLPDVPDVARWAALVGGLGVVVLMSIRQSILIDRHAELIVAERALRQTEGAYRVLYEQAADGILIADQQGNCLDLNPSAAAMLQLTRQEFAQRHAIDIITPEQRERVASSIENVLCGATVQRDWMFLRKDGSTFPAEVVAKLLPDGRIMALVRDISERQALEGQLRQAQKMEAMGTLAAGIAHDFNNLLTAISGNTEMATIEVGPNHKALNSLGQIRVATTRASALVRQIVAFSRPRAPKAESVLLPALVDEVVGLLRSTLPAGVELSLSCDPNVPTVHVDASQLHQVLVNLGTNAWQAMDGQPGSIRMAIERARLPAGAVLGLEAGVYACIAVVDSGKGMDARTRERIFEPFFTTKHVGEGTGLGLAIAHSIVRSHRGAITVESELDVGTTFRVYLPAVEAARASVRPVSEASARISRNHARVIYVDDEPALVLLMTRHLEELGYRVQSFTSPELALATIQRDPDDFDVLVTDFNMPKLSGIDLLTALLPLRPDAPFILASGYIDTELRARAETLHVKQLLQKPHTLDDLQQAVAQVDNSAKRPRRAAS